MIDLFDRATKLKWRRRFRRSRRQVEDLGVQAEEQLEQHLFRRLNRLTSVRRFVVSWVLLMVLLIGGMLYQFVSLGGYYQTLHAVPGGIYTEGILGSFTNANPLFATGSVDGAVSRLLFDGLLKYDENGQLTTDLAQSWSVDASGTQYTVKLRPNLTWQDGTPLTAQDVVFTCQSIQNPDVKSPLLASWQGVVVSSPDQRTVVFKLPNPLAAFPHSLVVGIVPKHILVNVPPQQLRSIRFNTESPVGSGPFKWDTIEVKGDTQETRAEQIAFVPNPDYFAGMPKLQQFRIRSFLSESTMVASFRHGELTAMSGLDALPDSLDGKNDVHEHSIPLSSAVAVFFRLSQDTLADVKVRQALVQSVDQKQIIAGLGYPVIPVREPFLSSQFPYDKSLVQPGYDVAAAQKLLDEDGWKLGKDGLRYKANKQLTFQLYSQNTSEYAYVTQQLQVYWRKVGVNASVVLQSDADLQATISRRNYDALLYGISIGPDPDVYAYWDSSQASVLSVNRLNLSDYKSSVADKALEAGRTRTDPTLRTIKYKPFLTAWRNDAPALMLYQPPYLYITSTQVDGLNLQVLNSTTDRYTNVQNWMIKRARVAD